VVGTLKTRKEATTWQKKFDPQAPKVGDLTPEFELCSIGGDESVRLSEYRRKKPVALIFGSFT
jgi:hypothetical protein